MKLNAFLASTIIAAGLGLAASTAAKADTFFFSYNIGTNTGSGEFDATLTGPIGIPGYGVYQITNVSGVANGQIITGISNYAYADEVLAYFPQNNPGYAGTDFLTIAGVSFTTAANTYNLFGTGIYGSYGMVDMASNPNGYDLGLRGTATISTSVPEMSTWAMFGLGFVGLGFVGASKRRGVVLAA